MGIVPPVNGYGSSFILLILRDFSPPKISKLLKLLKRRQNTVLVCPCRRFFQVKKTEENIRHAVPYLQESRREHVLPIRKKNTRRPLREAMSIHGMRVATKGTAITDKKFLQRVESPADWSTCLFHHVRPVIAGNSQ